MTSYPIPQSEVLPPFSGGHVLIASSNILMRKRVLESLVVPVQRCEQANGGAEALLRLESGSWQTLFLDRCLPDLDAIELSQTVRRLYPTVEVVLLDPEPLAEQATDRAVDGAPFSSGSVIPHTSPVAFAQKSAEAIPRSYAPLDKASTSFDPPTESYGFRPGADTKRGDTLDGLRDPLPAPDPLPGMIGNSAVMQPVYRMVRLLAKRNTAVLITGPTGCGKELVARALHQLSPRSERGFAVVNCAAIPETLLEAELFGYARGAFTGAMQAYAGRIQAAHGGTLFLDEVGEMPLSLQPKLLRFLEQKEVQRLGSSEVIRVDARIVSATNAHLLSLVREGKFREDLYYRLCGFPIDIPALRDRGEDVTLLAEHFLQKFSQGPGLRPNPAQLSIAARQLLEAQPWPGNIRELQNVMERALILAENRSVIRPEHLMLNPAHAHNFN